MIDIVPRRRVHVTPRPREYHRRHDRHNYEPGWYVYCLDLERGPFSSLTEAIAERDSYEVGPCPYPHRVRFCEGLNPAKSRVTVIQGVTLE